MSEAFICDAVRTPIGRYGDEKRWDRDRCVLRSVPQGRGLSVKRFGDGVECGPGGFASVLEERIQ